MDESFHIKWPHPSQAKSPIWLKMKYVVHMGHKRKQAPKTPIQTPETQKSAKINKDTHIQPLKNKQVRCNLQILFLGLDMSNIGIFKPIFEFLVSRQRFWGTKIDWLHQHIPFSVKLVTQPALGVVNCYEITWTPFLKVSQNLRLAEGIEPASMRYVCYKQVWCIINQERDQNGQHFIEIIFLLIYNLLPSPFFKCDRHRDAVYLIQGSTSSSRKNPTSDLLRALDQKQVPRDFLINTLALVQQEVL